MPQAAETLKNRQQQAQRYVLQFVLVFAVYFALQGVRGVAPAPEVGEILSSERAGLGRERAAT